MPSTQAASTDMHEQAGNTYFIALHLLKTQQKVNCSAYPAVLLFLVKDHLQCLVR
jgi:hypothetical protein